MRAYLLRRLGYLIVVLLVVTFLVAVMIEFLPGDPGYAVLGENATPEQVAQVHKELNLDTPLPVRYVNWLARVAKGDFGRSLKTGLPVSSELWQRLPVTLELVLLAQVVALSFAVLVGCFAAYRPRRAFDNASTFLSFAMISTPQFVLGIVLILYFGVQLGWFPVAGWVPLSDGIFQNLKHAIVPVIAIAADPAGVYQRLLRTDMVRTLDEEYVAVAQSKGLSPVHVVTRHALRPSMVSVTTLAGITTARLIGGSVVVESIFALPGVGRLLVDSIYAHDFVVIQGVVALIAAGYVVINTGVDLLQPVLDPRVRS